MLTTNTRIEIITIGDEILIGQIVDTNSAWMGQHLNAEGFKIIQITSAQDNREHILECLAAAEQRADVILITGGLGPTKDDITKKTLCEYFNCESRIDADVLGDITEMFRSYGREMTPVQVAQASIPAIAKALRNPNGTAPGIWIEKGTKVFCSMPGVPYEMMGIMKESAIPLLKKHFNTPAIVHKTILTQGIGESILADIISTWEDALPENIKLAYLPSVGAVRLRISAFGESEVTLQQQVDEASRTLLPLIEKYVYGFDDESLESNIGKLLNERKQTLSLAESCTGGYISHLITKVPGSSAYYLGSIISYAYEIKDEFLGVDPKLFDTVGAVSEEVVTKMAQSIREKFRTDYSLACSGIAGPDGGTNEKPVGTVWIAVASKHGVTAKKYLFGNHRLRTIERTGLTALMMLRTEILKG